jgi:hypothetical protein
MNFKTLLYRGVGEFGFKFMENECIILPLAKFAWVGPMKLFKVKK